MTAVEFGESVRKRPSCRVDFPLDDRSAGRKLLNLLEGHSYRRRRMIAEISEGSPEGERDVSFTIV
jgi:hypothetical protein